MADASHNFKSTKANCGSIPTCRTYPLPLFLRDYSGRAVKTIFFFKFGVPLGVRSPNLVRSARLIELTFPV